MHTIHHTEAIVVRSEPSGEANKRVWLFTKEFGLIIVMVQGVRKPMAKLQGHISDYSVIAADIIKGKSTWRLISAAVMATPLYGHERSPLARAYVRSVALTERFVVGEGVHEALFDHIRVAGEMVKGDYDARAFDVLSLWKILVMLGYCAVEDDEQLLFTAAFDQAVTTMDDAMIKKLIKSATTAITHSHL
jgi:recombinational DNA repair protein (RecF pathway)